MVQADELDLKIDRIVTATGSAGTHAGLVAGLAVMGADIPVLGIGVRAPARERGNRPSLRGAGPRRRRGRLRSVQDGAHRASPSVMTTARPISASMASMIAAQPELCVCEITPAFDLSSGTISHHLKLLREAGLVDCERRGTFVYYWIRPEALGALSTLPASKLGEVAIKAALERAGVSGGEVDEVILGHVLQAAAGQGPARQAAVGEGHVEAD